MGRHRKNFSLTKRKKKRTTVWYYQYYDEASGKRTHALSTGIRINEPRSKTRAREYCRRVLEDKKLLPPPKRGYTLNEYIEKERWLHFTENVYIKDKVEREQYGLKHFYEFKRYTEKWILPRFGHLRLMAISENDVKKWILTIDRSRSFRNNVIKTFRVLLRQAHTQGYINHDPLTGLKQYRQTRDAKELEKRGVLTRSEINELFFSVNVKNYWQDYTRAYGAACIAAETGMRQGEVLALMPNDICLINERPCILVRHSWDKITHSIKGTKSGDARIAPIREFLYSYLQKKIVGNGFIFSKNGEKPISSSYLNHCFYFALKRMGIDRIERKIVFHSLRHSANSLFINSGIPEAKVRAAIGHESVAMTNNYHHLHADDLLDIRLIQDKFDQPDLSYF